MVDLQKGERYSSCPLIVSSPLKITFLSHVRQINVDYALCQATSYNTGEHPSIVQLLMVYDIMCQYWVNFQKRLKRNMDTLTFKKFQKVCVAVGKFHLGAHVHKCFWEYSLNFIVGSGQIDGEIMETLWSLFNKFAVMGRAMSKWHRREILNDHMRDVNWKKTVGMSEYRILGFSLC
jgi:hypothetical protein